VKDTQEKMQAPVVTVELFGTKYVTFKRRVEVFNELMNGTGGQVDEEYNHVRRGYNCKVAKRSVGRQEVTMVPALGGCKVGDRMESLVYRGLSLMMQEAGFVTRVNETEQWIRITPQGLWRERIEEGSEYGCVVTRSGRACKYCESVSRGETSTRDSEVSEEVTTKTEEGTVPLEERYGKMSVEEAVRRLGPLRR